jgi:antirestriction protein ArdC
MNQVYEIVTKEICRKLEQGVLPWRKPWKDGAVNWVSQKGYRGINALLLDAGEYATFKQITEHGGHVRKGEHGKIVVFFKRLNIVDHCPDDEELVNIKNIAYLRYYKVFEINTQCEGLKSKRKVQDGTSQDPITTAEKIVEGYKDAPPVTFAGGRAFYKPSTDKISVPAITDYDKAEEYYSTLFHEMTHSTGHKSRLNRAGVIELAAFGSETYSKEELVAEVGAAMLCSVAGIEQTTIDNSAAYCNSWLRKLREDSKMINIAAGQAQKAADYIQGVKVD